MVQEQWQQLKMKFLLGYNIKTVTLWGKLTFAGRVYWGEFFQVVGGECPNFWLVGEGLPPPPILQYRENCAYGYTRQLEKLFEKEMYVSLNSWWAQIQNQIQYLFALITMMLFYSTEA